MTDTTSTRPQMGDFVLLERFAGGDNLSMRTRKTLHLALMQQSNAHPSPNLQRRSILLVQNTQQTALTF